MAAIDWDTYTLASLLQALDLPHPVGRVNRELGVPVVAHALSEHGWPGTMLIRQLRTGRSQFYLSWNGEVCNLSGYALPKGPGRVVWTTTRPDAQTAQEAVKNLDPEFASRLRSRLEGFFLQGHTPASPARFRVRL